MKRRNFLKMIPVGFLAAKFGGLVELVKPKIVSVPFTFIGNIELPSAPTWDDSASDPLKDMLNAAESVRIDGRGYCKKDYPELTSVTYV